MDIYAQIVVKIIKAQETIIGPVAIEQAQQVSSLKIDWQHQQVDISGDEADAIDRLIDKYKTLFGQISTEVSKEAAASLLGKLSPDDVPKALK